MFTTEQWEVEVVECQRRLSAADSNQRKDTRRDGGGECIETSENILQFIPKLFDDF